MLNLPNVTLVCVSSVEIENSIKSLLYSAKEINFGAIKLITHVEVEPDKSIKVETCRHLNSLDAYSHYMIYDLYKHIDTEFCLTVQHDAYVTNPECWTDDFLKYDYIGAPWPYMDVGFLDPFNNHIRVGNGGFSLRSKKLLSVVDHEHIPIAATMHDKFYNHLDLMCANEDYIVCVHNRHIYEKYGNIFAPIDVAAKFSFEVEIEEFKDVKSFGQHGTSITKILQN